MSIAFSLPPLRAPMTDANGLITAPWVQWMRTLYDRVGGPVASSIGEIESDLPEDAGIEELKASLFALADGLDQAPAAQAGVTDDEFLQAPPYEPVPLDIDTETRLAAMAEEIAVLRQQIQDLRQGAFQS